MSIVSNRPAVFLRDSEAHGDLDALAETLKDICRLATLDLAFRVGEVVIERLFAGNAALWESEGVRRTSYRSLASRGDLPLSASALCRCVGVYVLVNQLGGRERWHHLTASHFQEVLPISGEARTTLLMSAEAGQWSVARLRQEARRYKTASPMQTRSVVRELRRIGLSLGKHQQTLRQFEPAGPRATSSANLRGAIGAIDAALLEIERLTNAEVDAPVPRLKSDIVELRPCVERDAGGKR